MAVKIAHSSQVLAILMLEVSFEINQRAEELQRTCHRRLGLLHVLLERDVCEGVLAKDGLGVEVRRHEPALPGHGLLGRQASHVGALKQ